MIVNGSSNRCVDWWARHLQAADNDSVRLVEAYGLRATTIRGMLQEMIGRTAGTNCANGFYQINLNPEPGEVLTKDKLDRARRIVEQHHGFEGQAYFIVMHVKHGRDHPHLIYSRIKLETMKAISDSHDARKNHAIAAAIAREFGWRQVPSPYHREPGAPRPKRAPKRWEMLRGAKSGIDPRQLKAQVTALRVQSETGQAFRQALESQGYQLVTGDRGLLILDCAGKEHSLARCCGITMAKLLAFMHDAGIKALPTLGQARERRSKEAAAAEQPATTLLPTEEPPPLEMQEPEHEPQPGNGTACARQEFEPEIERAARQQERQVDLRHPSGDAIMQLRPLENGEEGNTGGGDGPELDPERCPKTAAPARSFLPGAVKKLFQEARKALSGKAPAPAPRGRRRSGTEESGRTFKKAARAIMSRLPRLPSQAYAAAAYLRDTLDWLNSWHDEPASEAGAEISGPGHSQPGHSQLAPHP